MDSDTLASALALLGTVGGFGLLGALIGREVAAQKATGRDNWHRPGGYPVDPALPDRLHGTMPAASLRPSADPATVRTAASPAPTATAPTGADAGPPLTVLPGGSGRLAGWTSSSGRPGPRSSRKPAA
ncbi:hypothetical protein [Kitasatospora purpeofusca]|uniref:hypothetical protein n=1 Tax=Kitasatospora purpeofusca TaxID=67352 RepID=UPI002A5AE4DB|nr:hypothetical protein [Kitasatospora purpeofusca]MDY0812066.1 hypothetical protein [Kitasatospora purpeofusca]